MYKPTSEFQKDNRPGKSWRVWCRPCRKIKEREYRAKWKIERADVPEKEEKRCSRCDQTLPMAEFVKDASRPDGRHVWCKACRKEVWLAFNDVNPDRAIAQKEKRGAKMKVSRLERLYGLSMEEYRQILEQQNGVCAICKMPQKGEKRLVVDHCHASGLLRGLLCDTCNWGLGLFRDSADMLIDAASYLRRPKLNAT